MLSIGTTRVVILTCMIGVCEVSMQHSARAQPPLNRAQAPLQKITAAWSHGSKADSHSATLAQRLDLRPPSEVQAGEQSGASGNHSLFAGESRWPAPRSSSPPPSEHIMSPMQTMAHNFHQEGLPIAKLFESNTSLVHLGLNPKGKPGLWIMHKTH